MAVNYGPKGEAVAKALGARGKVTAPPFAKGSDSATPAVALGHIDPNFFRPSDFAVDCDGCTACCKGDDGPRINEDEVVDYQCHQDDKGEWRLDQGEDGWCVYLDSEGCSIHEGRARDPDDGLPACPPYVCRAFDCRSLIIKFNNRGLDYMVNSKQLPLDVVIQGRKQLQAFNRMIELRATTVGADLTEFLMVPAEEREDATPDDAA